MTCQRLFLNDLSHFEKLEKPPKKNLCQADVVEKILYFFYNQETNLDYELWFNNLFHVVPTQDRDISFNSTWTDNKLYDYLSIRLNVKITILKQTNCAKYIATQHDPSCLITICEYNSYITLLNPGLKHFVFITRKGRNAGVFLLKSKPFFPILYSTLDTTPVNELEHQLVSNYKIPHFSLLEAFLTNSDPLNNIDAHIRILAADSIFTGSSSNLHCLGNWGRGASEVINVILIYKLQEGWTCVYNVSIQNLKLEVEMPLKTKPLQSENVVLNQGRRNKFQEEKCVCTSLSDYFIPKAKHQIFKPVGVDADKDILTLLKIMGWYTPEIDRTFQLISKISVMSFDIESLTIDEMNIPVNKIGIASTDDVGYLQGRYSYQTQTPFVLGTTSHDLDHLFDKYFKNRTLKTKYKQFMKGKLSESEMLSVLYQYKVQDLTDYIERELISKQTTKIFHIEKNDQSDQCSEPNTVNIEEMILNFLEYAYRYAKKAKLIKCLLTYYLSERLSTIQKAFASVLESKSYSDIWSKTKNKLTKIQDELFLISFNGSGYDLPLIENYLWNCCIRLKLRRPLFFKRASLINSVNLRINNWKEEKKCSINLTFKDAKFLQEANVSLATLGQKYSVSTSKGLFPHAISVSVRHLKFTDRLPTFESAVWFNILNNSKPTPQDVDQAHKDFNDSKSNNLYEYCISYLVKDCQVLFDVFIKMIDDWTESGINFILARKFTISSLVFHLFYIQNKMNNPLQIAPGQIVDPLCYCVCDAAIVGGYTAVHASGCLDSSFIINQHLNKVNLPTNSQAFPSFDSTTEFKLNLNGVIGLDIRSQYAQSSTLNLPCGPGLFLQTLNIPQIPKKPIIDICSFCKNLQENSKENLTVEVVTPDQFLWKQEFYAVQDWLKKRVFETEINENGYVLEICYSATTPGGQLNVHRYFVDCYVLLRKNNKYKILLFNYHGYSHGCAETCEVKNPFSSENIAKRTVSQIKDQKLQQLVDIWRQSDSNLDIEIEIQYPCDTQHKYIKSTPKLISDIVPKRQSYNQFLDLIYKKQYRGFLVVKDLEIKDHVPAMGFCIQRSTVDPELMYSSFMKENYTSLKKNTVVLGLNKFKGIKVIHSDYFVYLKQNFGFTDTPFILHSVLFNHEVYLKEDIEKQLQLRALIKEKLKNPNLTKHEISVLNSKSSQTKLRLNGTYGFTLLKSGSMNSSYSRETLCASKRIHLLQEKTNIVGYERLNKEYFKVASKTVPNFSFTDYEIPLLAVGGTILSHSKIILLKNLQFLLSHLDPAKAMLVYLDTDSCYWAVHHKKLEDNILPHLKQSFDLQKDNFIDSSTLLAGYLVTECIADKVYIYGEKMYRLGFNEHEPQIHLKSIARGLHKELNKEENSKRLFPGQNTVIIQTGLRRQIGGGVNLVTESKNIVEGVQPKKRKFLSSGYSITY